MTAWALLALLVSSPLGRAADDAAGDVADEESVSFPKRESASVKLIETPERRTGGWWTVTRAEGEPYDEAALRGAEQLGLDPGYVQGVRDGLHLAFLRDYEGARVHMHKLDNQYPGTGIAAAVDAVVWQAIMLENWNFQYEAEYLEANEKAQDQLHAALAEPGTEGWEHFLLAGMLGVEAIHTLRREKVLAALQLALDAMTEAGKSREASPEFTDLFLADGMYNYWRTVVTQSNRFLPDFGDRREEGIEQIKTVEQDGVFLGPPATLALAFSYIEERRLDRAFAACTRNAKVYPDNIINLLVLGQIETQMRRYDDALATWDHIAAVDPNNQRVLYWRGVTLLKAGRSEEALAPLQAYLAVDYLEKHHRSWAHYRLGQVYYRMKEYALADEQYTLAVKTDGHKSARAALDRMRRLRRDGRISY